MIVFFIVTNENKQLISRKPQKLGIEHLVARKYPPPSKPILFGNIRKFSTKISHSKCAHNIGTLSRI